MIEAAITVSGVISEKQAVQMIQTRIEKYLRDSNEDNFNEVCGGATILALMPHVRKHGIKKVLLDVKKNESAHELMERLSGKYFVS